VIRKHIFRAIGSLKHMMAEMSRKGLDLSRLTKTAGILLSIGVSRNSIPDNILAQCLEEQRSDGGWVGITDTMWNTYFLLKYDHSKYESQISRGVSYLKTMRAADGLWGRSERDRSRIPVTGMILYLLPQLATPDILLSFEQLWWSERNTLTYKAAYSLMAMARCSYVPRRPGLIEDTVEWLVANQREDGSFAPWRSHPVPSNVFYTSIAVLGLAQYPHLVPSETFAQALQWLIQTQLPQGIWGFHEIEDGTSWGVWALFHLSGLLAARKGNA